MSDAKAAGHERCIAYVVRLLQMSPAAEGEAIVHARSKALGLGAKSVTAPANGTEPRDQKRKLLEQIEALRAVFWTMPLPALENKLAKLDAGQFPDLQAVVVRLRTVAAHRHEFPKLAGQRGFDGDFFKVYRQVLTDSPRDVAVLKEQIISSFRNRSTRKRGRGMVQLLKNQMPKIYELEADWLEALYRQKARPREFLVNGAKRSSWSFDLGGRGWVYWITFWVLVQIVRTLMRNP